MSGSGTTIANGGLTMGLGGGTLNDGRTMENHGAAVWSDGPLFMDDGALFVNAAGASFLTSSGPITLESMSWSLLTSARQCIVRNDASSCARVMWPRCSNMTLKFRSTASCS